ncbi:nitroreductase [Xylanimonas cellulosilytica DSM 15894]|uniref:Nitroreductase n=1 Tax=Xylanimonas cellulosilytica (strain DSM 15894 / JCM 12276 / CECT 5975 / KCTC 9989 / LMG 20990 / NBRC 107835 / XIL07) TaxID=446471 RepID=D1BZX1_XYLCX|nr:NADPH-dependent oxidoreductase [Xylanimonas cellulosilytica]ACZ32099.1 nitroreductase [Xylanimonas cellulosilytica DSM 15894]
MTALTAGTTTQDVEPVSVAQAVAARYGVPATEADAVAPGVADALAALAARTADSGERAASALDVQLAHRSVRAFLPDALPYHVLPTLVAAAQSAPSSSNLQLWSVVAVTDAARKDRIATVAGNQEHVREAPLLLVFVADTARAGVLGGDVELEGAQYLESTLVGAVDAALAAQNAVVAAEALGLGTVYLGAVRNDVEAVAAELGLPPGAVPVVGLVVGHPDPARPARVKPRLPQSAVLHHDTYDLAGQIPALAAYEERITSFYRAEGLEGGWSARVVERLRGHGSLRGRERLRAAFTALGLASR